MSDYQDFLLDADALTDFLDADALEDEQGISAEDLQVVLPDTFADTFAWSPPSSPTPFPIPAPSSSSVDTVVTGDSTTSLAAASASTDTNTSFPSATTQPTVLQTQEHALLTTSAYASTSSSTTSTTAGDGARVTPLATVHHHGVILGDVTTTTTTTTTSAQMAPVQGLAESSPAVTSTTRSSRSPSPQVSSDASSLIQHQQQTLQELQLQLQQLKQQEAQLLQQQALTHKHPLQPQQLPSGLSLGGLVQQHTQSQQQQQPQQPSQQQQQQQPQQVLVGSAGLQIIQNQALVPSGQVGQSGQITQINQLAAQLGQVNQLPNQGGQIAVTKVTQATPPPKAGTPVSTQHVQPKTGITTTQAQPLAMSQQSVQQQAQQVFTFAQQSVPQQQQQALMITPHGQVVQHPIQSQGSQSTSASFAPTHPHTVTLTPQLTPQQQQLAQLAQQQLLQQQQQQQQNQQVTIANSQAGTQQPLQNNLLVSAVRPQGAVQGAVQVRPQGNLNLVQGALPTGMILQTSSGNRILLQAPQLVASQLATGQLTQLPAGIQFQPASVSSAAGHSTQTASTSGNQTITAAGAIATAHGGKPIAMGQPMQQVLNIAGAAPGQQQQIVIQRTPGPNGTQNQNIILRTIPTNMIQFQGSAVSGTATSTTVTPSLGNQAGQVVLSQGALPAGQIQLPQSQVANAVGQPQVLGGLNMVNNAHSININVLPAPLHSLQGIQQTVQNSSVSGPSTVNIQPKPAVTVPNNATVVTHNQSTAQQVSGTSGTASSTMLTSQQQQVQLADSNIKVEPGTSNMATATAQQLSFQQLQSLGVLPANLGQVQTAQGTSASDVGGATTAQVSVNSSVAQILQTVSATAAKQVNMTTPSQMHTMVLANPSSLRPAPGQTIQALQPQLSNSTNVAIPASSLGQQQQQTLSYIQSGQQVVLGPGTAGQFQNLGQLPLLKPKQEPLTASSTPAPLPNIPTPPPPPMSVKNPVVNLTVGTPPQTHVSPGTQASKVIPSGNIPAIVASAVASSVQMTQSQTVVSSVGQFGTATTSTSSTGGAANKQTGVSSTGTLQNFQNMMAPPNVNIQNMPQLQVKNLSQLPATAGSVTTSTSQPTNTSTSPSQSVVIRPKGSSTPGTKPAAHGGKEKTTLPPNLPIQGPMPVPVNQLQSQLAQLQSQLGQQQVKFQTIQLSAQNQELLKTIQQKIKVFMAIENRTPAQQKNLQRLLETQQKILTQGKIALQQQLQQAAKLQQHQQQQQQQHLFKNAQRTNQAIKLEPGTIKIEPGTVAPSTGQLSIAQPIVTAVSSSTTVMGQNKVQIPITAAQLQTNQANVMQLRPIAPQQIQAGTNLQTMPVQATTVQAPANTKAGTFTAASEASKVPLLPSGTPVKVGNQIQIPIHIQEKLKQNLAKMTPEQQQAYIRQQLPVLLHLQQQAMRQQQQQQQKQQQQQQQQKQQQQQQVQAATVVTVQPQALPTVTTNTNVTPQTPANVKAKIPITVQVAANATPGKVTVVTQTTQATATLATVTTSTKAAGQKRPVVQALSKTALTQRQLTQDQNHASNPDVKRPFKNRRDAIQRLIRYHVFNSIEPTLSQVVQEEAQYEEEAQELLERKQQMLNKYRLLLFDDAMRLEQTSEMVMLERMFIQDEREELKDDQLVAKEDPDNFVPRPIIKDSDSEEEEVGDKGVTRNNPIKIEDSKPNPDFLEPIDTKRIKLEPGTLESGENQPTPSPKLSTIKKEKDVEEPKPSASPSYTLHSTGGLKIVIKNSPIHMKSPARLEDPPISSQEVKDDFKSPFSRRDRLAYKGTPQRSPLRSPLMSPAPSPLTSPFRSPSYRMPESGCASSMSQGSPVGVKEEPDKPMIDQDDFRGDDNVVMEEEDVVVPFCPSSTGGRDSDAGSPVVPIHHRQTADSFSSSQDGTESSEADAAVAGLLSSTSVDPDEDMPELLPPMKPRVTSSSLHSVCQTVHPRVPSKDIASTFEPKPMEAEGTGGELTAAVDSLMADFHDIGGATNHAAEPDIDLNSLGANSPGQPHYSERHSFDMEEASFNSRSHQSEAGFFSHSEEKSDMVKFFAPPAEEPESIMPVSQSFKEEEPDSTDSNQGPHLNEEVQSAINSILSFQQVDMAEDHSADLANQSFGNQSFNSENSTIESFDMYPGGGDSSQTDPMQDDLDAAVQSILM